MIPRIFHRERAGIQCGVKWQCTMKINICIIVEKKTFSVCLWDRSDQLKADLSPRDPFSLSLALAQSPWKKRLVSFYHLRASVGSNSSNKATILIKTSFKCPGSSVSARKTPMKKSNICTISECTPLGLRAKAPTRYIARVVVDAGSKSCASRTYLCLEDRETVMSKIPIDTMTKERIVLNESSLWHTPELPTVQQDSILWRIDFWESKLFKIERRR